MKIRLFSLVLCLFLLACTARNTQPTNSTTATPLGPTESFPTLTPSEMPSSTPTPVQIPTPGPEEPKTPSQSRPANVIPLLNNGSAVDLNVLKMVTPAQGWGIARDIYQNDHIVTTSDGGHTWQDVTPPESSPTSGQTGKQALAFFLDPQNAWAIYWTNDPNNGPLMSPRVWYTSDNGRNWQASTDLDTSAWEGGYSIPAFFDFIDAQTGFLALKHDPGAGQAPMSIFRSQDGGASWKLTKEPMGQGDSFINACCQTGMAFINFKNGIITKDPGPVGRTYLNWTSDSGVTWVDQYLPSPDSQLFTSGMCGTYSPTDISSELVRIVVTCLQDAKSSATPSAFLYSTSDLGKTWTFSSLPDPPWDQKTWPYIRRADEIQFLDSEDGWLFTVTDLEKTDGSAAQTDNYLYHTQDGGKSWQAGGKMTGSGQFNFVDTQLGWVLLKKETQTILQQTTNGGQTWQMVNPVITLKASEVSQPNPTPALQPLTVTGKIAHFQPGQSYELDTVKMIDANHGWAMTQTAAEDGHVLYTQNGGLNWLDVTPPETASSNQDMLKRPTGYFQDAENAWITYYPLNQPSSSPTLIWHTQNGGSSWQPGGQLQPQGTEGGFSPLQFYFVDAQNGWFMLSHGAAAGSQPITIYQTQDGGKNWQRILNLFSPSSDGVNTCCQSGLIFSDHQNGLITTSFGPDPTAHVSWTRDGGKSWQRQELPLPTNSLKQAFCNTVSPRSIPPQTIHLIMECSTQAEQKSQDPLNYIYTTTDLGNHWSSFPLPKPPLETNGYHYNRRDRIIEFINPQTGWLFITDFYESGDGLRQKMFTHLYKTIDNGQTWESIGEVNWAGTFSFVDQYLGWAIARDFPDQYAFVQTSDGGHTWRIIYK